MAKNTDIKLFENKKIRSVWDSEDEKWYISIVDVVEVLTESSNSRMQNHLALSKLSNYPLR